MVFLAGYTRASPNLLAPAGGVSEWVDVERPLEVTHVHEAVSVGCLG